MVIFRLFLKTIFFKNFCFVTQTMKTKHEKSTIITEYVLKNIQKMEFFHGKNFIFLLNFIQIVTFQQIQKQKIEYHCSQNQNMQTT